MLCTHTFCHYNFILRTVILSYLLFFLFLFSFSTSGSFSFLSNFFEDSGLFLIYHMGFKINVDSLLSLVAISERCLCKLGPQMLGYILKLPDLTAAAAEVTSVMFDSMRPHRWQPTGLPCPWDSPGKNTGVGCHFLLQCVKVKSESEVTQSCPTLRDPMDCSLPGSSVHEIFQARVLK